MKFIPGKLYKALRANPRSDKINMREPGEKYNPQTYDFDSVFLFLKEERDRVQRRRIFYFLTPGGAVGVIDEGSPMDEWLERVEVEK